MDKFAVQLDELTTYLKDHADNEEECVLKPLEQRAPDAIKRDLEVHGRLVEEEKRFVALFSDVRQQTDKGTRLDAGLAFYRGVADYVSIYLPHMLAEEKDTMDALWKHFNDEELVGMFQSIMKKTNQLWVVEVETEGGFTAERPTVLFEGPYMTDPNGQGVPNYDVSLDGQQFLMVRSAEVAETPGFVVVENWFEELKARVPVP